MPLGKKIDVIHVDFFVYNTVDLLSGKNFVFINIQLYFHTDLICTPDDRAEITDGQTVADEVHVFLGR